MPPVKLSQEAPRDHRAARAGAGQGEDRAGLLDRHEQLTRDAVKLAEALDKVNKAD